MGPRRSHQFRFSLTNSDSAVSPLRSAGLTMARQNSALHSAITVAKARRSLVSAANESGHSSGVLAGKIRRLERLSTDQTRNFSLNFRAFRIMSDKPHYRTLFSQDKRGGFGGTEDDKAPPWVMLRPWSDSRPPTSSTTKLPPPIRAARRPSPCRGGDRAGCAAPRFAPTNPLVEQAVPSWARPPNAPAAGADAGVEAAFLAGAGLALLDQILRTDPPFAGALRQRLALARRRRLRRPDAPSRGFFRAARRRASFAQRRRERGHQPRRPHPSAVAPVCVAPDAARRFNPAHRRRSSRTAGRPRVSTALAEALRDIVAGAEHPLAAAAGASRRGDETVSRGAARRRRDFRALAVRPRLGANAQVGRTDSAAGDDDRAAVVAVGGPPAAPGRRRLAAPLRHGRRARRAGGSWARRRSFAAIGEAVERRAKAEGERGGASDRNAARRRRGFSGDRGESREAVGSRQPASIRSAGRARRRARIVGAAQFSALRLIGIGNEPSQKT